MKGVLNFLLAVWERAKKETEIETREISDKNLEIEENKTFTYIALSSDKFFSENSLKDSSKNTLKEVSSSNKKDN